MSSCRPTLGANDVHTGRTIIGIKEIKNLENAMSFIEENIKTHKIDRAFLSEMHKIIVKDLLPPPDGEGDRTPGEYRKVDLKISKSKHIPPNWMKVLIRDINDPLSIVANNKAGGVNIIDLANIDSCSFIATQDLGIKMDENRFKINGRFSNADVRGCNLLVQ